METSGIKRKRQFTFNKNFPSRSKHWAQIFGSITVQAHSTVDYCLYTLCRDAAAVGRKTVTEYRTDTHRCSQKPICFCYRKLLLFSGSSILQQDMKIIQTLLNSMLLLLYTNCAETIMCPHFGILAMETCCGVVHPQSTEFIAIWVREPQHLMDKPLLRGSYKMKTINLTNH